MIARLAPDHGQTDAYARFLKQLGNEGFQGEIAGDLGSRTVLATDNSIYQRLPQAAVFPKTYADVELVAKLAAHPQYRSVVLTPSRHLNGILEINVEERWVRVQSGVVKDQLNAALKPHGLFFAPELSTSNRATIGGMINTDASGQGSCTYGKTRDHVLALSTVLLGGQRLDSQPLAAEQADREAARQDRIGSVYRCTRDIADQQAQLIKDTFPPLNRCLTGYDLAHLREADGGFNLNSILCGSEGSLGFIIEAKLNVLPIPRHSILVNVQYTAFMDALRDAKALMALKPLSIETVDSKVLRLAMQDIVWHGVAEYFPPIPGQQTLGINLIEFSDDDQESLERRVHDFIEHLKSDTSVVRLGHTLAVGSEAVTRVYTMRKRSVGLLGNVQGEARPQPFVAAATVRGRHRRAAGKPRRLHRRVPRPARLAPTRIRHVRPRRRRRAARATDPRHEGHAPGGADPADFRWRGRAHAKVRWLVVGRAWQGPALRVLPGPHCTRRCRRSRRRSIRSTSSTPARSPRRRASARPR